MILNSCFHFGRFCVNFGRVLFILGDFLSPVEFVFIIADFRRFCVKFGQNYVRFNYCNNFDINFSISVYIFQFLYAVNNGTTVESNSPLKLKREFLTCNFP